jgi:hypothetical protein
LARPITLPPYPQGQVADRSAVVIVVVAAVHNLRIARKISDQAFHLLFIQSGGCLGVIAHLLASVMRRRNQGVTHDGQVAPLIASFMPGCQGVTGGGHDHGLFRRTVDIDLGPAADGQAAAQAGGALYQRAGLDGQCRARQNIQLFLQIVHIVRRPGLGCGDALRHQDFGRIRDPEYGKTRHHDPDSNFLHATDPFIFSFLGIWSIRRHTQHPIPSSLNFFSFQNTVLFSAIDLRFQPKL